MKFLFWLGVVGVVYIYLGYPFFLTAMAALARRAVGARDTEPFVSLFLLDDAGRGDIVGKIDGLVTLDYPREKVEILAGCDGASDETYRSVKKIAEEKNIRYAVSFQKIGRCGMINKLAKDARGEIFVFLDAAQKYEKSFLRRLLRSFGDPAVGFVCGDLIFEGRRQPILWSAEGRETVLRMAENVSWSILSPTLSVYAIRRDIFKYLPENSAFSDDAYALMNAVAADLRAVVDASVRTRTPGETVPGADALARQVRMLIGDFQLCSVFAEVAMSFKNRMAFRFLSHKVLPLALPYFLLGIFLANVFLVKGGGFFLTLFLAQAVFYGMAFVAYLAEKAGARFAFPLRLPYEFCFFGLSAVLALRLWLSGEYNLKWQD